MGRRLYLLLFVALLLLPGCMGGGSRSTSASEAEIINFFNEFAYLYETKDVEGIIDMFVFPIVMSFEESSLEMTQSDRDEVRQNLSDMFYMAESVECRTVVESATGTTSTAYASVIMTSHFVYSYGFESETVERVRFGLTKKSGKWRIKSMHVLSIE